MLSVTFSLFSDDADVVVEVEERESNSSTTASTDLGFVSLLALIHSMRRPLASEMLTLDDDDDDDVVVEDSLSLL